MARKSCDYDGMQSDWECINSCHMPQAFYINSLFLVRGVVWAQQMETYCCTDFLQDAGFELHLLEQCSNDATLLPSVVMQFRQAPNAAVLPCKEIGKGRYKARLTKNLCRCTDVSSSYPTC